MFKIKNVYSRIGNDYHRVIAEAELDAETNLAIDDNGEKLPYHIEVYVMEPNKRAKSPLAGVVKTVVIVFDSESSKKLYLSAKKIKEARKTFVLDQTKSN